MKKNDVNVVVDNIEKMVTKAKFRRYGKRSLTKKKFQKFKDDEMWKTRMEEMDKIQEAIEA